MRSIEEKMKIQQRGRETGRKNRKIGNGGAVGWPKEDGEDNRDTV